MGVREYSRSLREIECHVDLKWEGITVSNDDCHRGSERVKIPFVYSFDEFNTKLILNFLFRYVDGKFDYGFQERGRRVS